MSAPHDRRGLPDAEPAERARLPMDVDPASHPSDADRTETDPAAIDVAAAADRAVEADSGRSPRRATCGYLRGVDTGGGLGPPFDGGSDENRCIAMGEPTPLSERQQSLVCLTMFHEDCPRYLRAILAIPMVEPVAAPTRRIHPATLVATMLLGVSVVVAVAFTAAIGGIAMPSDSTPNPDGSEVAAASPTPSIAPSQSPSQAPTSNPTMTAGPSPSVSPSSPATPRPSPSATATPLPSATPRPTSDRYELLEPCPDRPDCYIYTVRAGDNLVSIANYFGVPLETVYKLNPWTRTSGLRAGRDLILPPPTR